MLLATALPMNMLAIEVGDTTICFGGKQFVISEDSVETTVTVFNHVNEQLVKTRETTYTEQQDVERFFISSPLFGWGKHRYPPTTPRFYIGFTGLAGSALGLSGADDVHCKLWGSYELGVNLIDVGFWLNRQKTWSLSATWNVNIADIRLTNGYVLTKDGDERSEVQTVDGAKDSRLFSYGNRFDLMLKWYHYFTNSENGRLSLGLGLSWDNVNMRNNFSSYKLDGSVQASAAALRLYSNRLGLRMQVSYEGFTLYMQKSLTPMFKSGFGPKCYPFSLGVGVSF